MDDARIAMLLYRAVKSRWENLIFTHGDRKSKIKTSKEFKNRRRVVESSSGDEDEDSVDKNNFNSILQ